MQISVKQHLPRAGSEHSGIILEHLLALLIEFAALLLLPAFITILIMDHLASFNFFLFLSLEVQVDIILLKSLLMLCVSNYTAVL